MGRITTECTGIKIEDNLDYVSTKLVSEYCLYLNHDHPLHLELNQEKKNWLNELKAASPIIDKQHIAIKKIFKLEEDLNLYTN